MFRKILFKKWVPIRWADDAAHKRIAGTGCWEEEYTQAGLFHEWGSDYETLEDGVGNYTIAIIELPNGEIVEILPSNIKFVE